MTPPPTNSELRDLWKSLNDTAIQLASHTARMEPLLKFVEQVQADQCPMGKRHEEDIKKHLENHAATRIKTLWAIMTPVIVGAVAILFKLITR